MNSLPTFIGIGGMRCGSTWLYEVLKCHPDVWLGHRKEVDFFFMRRMLQHEWSWYQDHFVADDDLGVRPVRGEISPRYSRLKAWQVNRIARRFPWLRIVFTIRHPIERAWSQAVYDFGRLQGRDVSQVRASEFLRHLERARSRLSSDYARTFEIWSRAFGRDAIHVGFFDRIHADPHGFTHDILKHIGADPGWELPQPYAEKKVFSANELIGGKGEMPEIVYWYMADQLLDSTMRLNRLLDGAASHWVDELREIRGRVRWSWRLARELNRTVICLPERLAYETFHVVLDARLWFKWRQLQRTIPSLTQWENELKSTP